MSVLIYAENTGGKFKKSTFEVISYANVIAKELKTNLVAISIGNVENAELEKLNEYMVNRELKMIELKKEIRACAESSYHDQKKVSAVNS